MTNILAYFITKPVIAVKSFKVLARGRFNAKRAKREIKGSNPPAATGIKWRKDYPLRTILGRYLVSAILFLWPQEDLNP